MTMPACYTRPRLLRSPARVSLACYDRACRAMAAIADRRGCLGIAVDDDWDARRWQAWNLAGMRQIWGGAFEAFGPISRRGVPETLERALLKGFGKSLGGSKSARASRARPRALRQPLKTGPAINPGRIAPGR